MAYRADIEIAVKGAQELKRLQDQVSATSKLVDGLNTYLQNIGSGGVVRSIQNLRNVVGEAAAAFNQAALSTDEAAIAARNYVTATNGLNAGLAERVTLLKSVNEELRKEKLAEGSKRFGGPAIRETRGTVELGPGAASPVGALVGQKSAVGDIISRTLQGKKDQKALDEALLKLEEKSAGILNKKLQLQESLVQGTQEVLTLIDQQAKRQQFLAGKSGTLMQGPLAGPGAMGFPVALPLTAAEQKGLATEAKKQEILRRMAATRQQLIGLAQNLQQIDTNAVVAIADAQRAQENLNRTRERELQIAEQVAAIRRKEAANSNAARQRLADEVARQQRVRDAGFGLQGPALPPEKPGKKSGGLGKLASGALSNAAVGGAFPLLFGQSGAAATGGALGGVLGSVVPGIGGFGGSLIGTILGEKLGQGNQVKQLGEDIGFSAEQTKMLGTAFQQAGRDFDKFQQSVSTIQGLSLSIDDQARAIQLASSLTESYKGKIDKVTNAFANALSTGKVTQGTLNQLTGQGIPIQQALADKYNVSRDAILQMAKDGKISVQDLIDTLVKVGNEGAKAAGTQKDVFADSFEQISKAVTDFQTTASQAFKETGDALRVDLGGAVQAVTTYITDLIGGFGELARVAGPVLDPIISGYINLEKAIFNAVGAVPALRDAIVQFVLQVAGPLAGVVTLMNQIKGLGAATKKPEKQGPYVPDRLKKKPLESFIAPAQAVPSGGSSGADKAAKAAEREAERVANIVRDQAALTEQKKLQAQYSQGLFVAEVAKDAALKIQLQREQKIGEISLQYSKQINDEKAKGNSAAVKEAFTRTALVDVQLVELATAQELKKLELDRKENFDNLLMDLNQEIALRSATTEEARNQLRIAYEMAKLQQTGMYNTDQLAAIQTRKQQLTAPKTPYETINLARGAASDELTKLLDVGNQLVTIGDAVGTSFSNSFKGIINGTMTAQEALAGFFQSVADAFLDMAAQIIAKWITMTILNSVLSLFPGGGGGKLSSLSAPSTISNPLGDLSGIGLPYKATGGPVAGGMPYIVGEKGPELFMPGRSGAIVPNNALGGGSTNVVVNVDASGNSNVQGDQAQAKQLGVVVSAAVQAELVKQQRPGGLLAGTRR